MRYPAPVMKAQGSGSILSTASVAGLQAGFGPHVRFVNCQAIVVDAGLSGGRQWSENPKRAQQLGKELGIEPD